MEITAILLFFLFGFHDATALCSFTKTGTAYNAQFTYEADLHLKDRGKRSAHHL
jgi:hypothetical protein